MCVEPLFVSHPLQFKPLWKEQLGLPSHTHTHTQSSPEQYVTNPEQGCTILIFGCGEITAIALQKQSTFETTMS